MSDRARQTLAQLEAARHTVLERDATGPLLIERRGVVVTYWRRVPGSGRGKDSVFELVEERP